MNNTNVEEMKIELERLNRIPEISEIASLENLQFPMKEFNQEWLHDEYQKITRARDKNYPTYRSEYRVIKTLIRQRNELIYYIGKTYPDETVKRVNTELVKISTLLTSTLKSISEIFEKEKSINDAANKYEREDVNVNAKHFH